MQSSDESAVAEVEESENLLITSEDETSSDERSMEWTSVTAPTPIENNKKLLYRKGLYSPGCGDICNDYISMSDSVILEHPHYAYPGVKDPGIEEALFGTRPVTFPDDGQELYLHLCSEMNLCPVKMFYDNLLSPVNSVKYYGVNPKGVRAMAMALQKNKIVTCLDMTDNFLTDDACYHLGEMLKFNNTLQELILDGCRICATGIQLLGDNLYINRKLVTLNLARNDIRDDGGVIFANQLSSGGSIKRLNLSKNSLGRETALALEEVLYWNQITHLDLSYNNFTHTPTTIRMLGSLAYSEFIQELNLSFNSFEGNRVAGVINKILNIPSLEILDLSHNRFKGEAVNIIIAGLINATKLVTFNLSYNPMTPQDAYNTLHVMLTPQVTLQQLQMENVYVHKSFLALLTQVSNMDIRKNFVVTYGYVLQNWTVDGPDPRELLLKRANYLGKKNKKRQIDIISYFLSLSNEWPKPVTTKILMERFNQKKIPLSEDFINELIVVFSGPETTNSRTIDFNLITEYIKRLWPEKRPETRTPIKQNLVLESTSSEKMEPKKTKRKF